MAGKTEFNSDCPKAIHLSIDGRWVLGPMNRDKIMDKGYSHSRGFE
jgi:hypothetical protein